MATTTPGKEARKERSDWQVYRRLVGYLRPHIGIFILAIFALVANAVADVGIAYILQPLLDDGLGGNSSKGTKPDQTLLIWLPLAVVGIFALRGGAGFVSSIGMKYVGQHVIADMRNQVFHKYLLFDNRYFDTNNSGELISRLIFTIEQVATSITSTLSSIVREILTIIFLIGLMFYLSSLLASIILLAGPVVVLIVRYISKRFRKQAKRIQKSVAGISRSAEQAVYGQKIVKMFGAHDFERTRFATANEKSRKARMKEAITLSASSPIIQVLVSIALAIVIYVAMLSNDMTPGVFAAFMAASGRILQPLRAIPGLISQLQKGIAAADDIFDIIETPDENDNNLPNLTIQKGSINIQDLAFAYDTAKGDVLYNINLQIPAGEMIALVGHSGSGKSTLAALLPRLYEWSQGKITIDEQDIQQVNRPSLRDKIALVSQEVLLFDDTIANNIAYAHNGSCKIEELRAAAEAANALDFIEALPDGFDTIVGERGVMLSGGQRQRISIARAILKDAPILILDEATSALDTESERKIQQALDKLMQGRTSLVIAHRLSTIEKADNIVVMQDGQVLEQGTHAELLNANQHYAKLHRLQFAEPQN